MTVRRALAALMLATPIATVSPVHADSATPTDTGLLAGIKAGEAVRMEYQIKANAWLLFLPITGKANFSVDLKPDTYRITSQVKTTGLADILVNYDMALAATGYVQKTGLETYAYGSQNSDGKKNRRVNIKYHPDSFDMTASPVFGDLGDPPASTEQVLDARDPITALISFALEPRMVDEDPCGGPLKIFDGRQLTYLHLENQGLTPVRSTAWSGDAYECHVRMERVAGYDADEINRDSLTAIDGPLRMWLAPLENGATVPVRIEANSKDIGTITLQAARLSFTPLSDVSD
ncbi:MAG: DUF3108 domain-containing protein [Henriciella sp.]|jgi:hypothetical protein